MEASLLNRLENAVVRLEALAGMQSGFGARHAAPPSSGQTTAGATTAAAPAALPASSGSSVAAALSDWDNLMSSCLKAVVTLSKGIDPQAEAAVRHMERGFLAVRGVLETSSRTKMPDPAGLQAMLAPVAAEMVGAASLTEGRRKAAFNVLKMVAEAMQALSWLAYTGPTCGLAAPPQLVADTWQSAEFYANKAMMEARNAGGPAADATVSWVRAVKELITRLEGYVRTHYPSGLKWNVAPAGSSDAALSTAPAVAQPPAVASGRAPPPPPAPPAPPLAPGGGRPGPPPPPPPGPPPKPLSVDALKEAQQQPAAGGANLSALFKELQKVTDDMKTKNRADKGPGVVSVKERGPAGAPGAASAGKPAGPPRMEFDADRKKWMVENQVGVRPLVIDGIKPNHSVYIYNCKDSVIQVPSKANAISVDGCTKTGVLCGDLIACLEVVNCRSLQLQCTGTVPTVSIEKCDGVTLYVPAALAAEGADFQVVTARCSEVNVVVVPEPPAPGSAEDDSQGPEEHPVPEQFVSTFKAGKLVTVAASHSGA